jgi:transposase
VYRYIERATGAWQECPPGVAARERTDAPKTHVQEVDSGEPGLRVFVVKSEERLGYEQAQRVKAMERVRAQLERLQQRVELGKLREPVKIGAAAARILDRFHGHRYYDWKYEAGHFDFFEHPLHLKREIAYEGKYVIQTRETGLTPVQAVSVYKELSEVERAFANLKDVIALRPVFHQTARRVQAHIFVASLAFLLHRAIEKRLKAAGSDLSATEALQVLRTVRVVDLQMGRGKSQRKVTRGTGRAAQILEALRISELDPPSPSPRGRTVP